MLRLTSQISPANWLAEDFPMPEARRIVNGFSNRLIYCLTSEQYKELNSLHTTWIEPVWQSVLDQCGVVIITDEERLFVSDLEIVGNSDNPLLHLFDERSPEQWEKESGHPHGIGTVDGTIDYWIVRYSKFANKITILDPYCLLGIADSNKYHALATAIESVLGKMTEAALRNMEVALVGRERFAVPNKPPHKCGKLEHPGNEKPPFCRNCTDHFLKTLNSLLEELKVIDGKEHDVFCYLSDIVNDDFHDRRFRFEFENSIPGSQPNTVLFVSASKGFTSFYSETRAGERPLPAQGPLPAVPSQLAIEDRASAQRYFEKIWQKALEIEAEP
jgi:hypothetical protein